MTVSSSFAIRCKEELKIKEEIDPHIAPLVFILNAKLGVKTYKSCEGHEDIMPCFESDDSWVIRLSYPWVKIGGDDVDVVRSLISEYKSENGIEWEVSQYRTGEWLLRPIQRNATRAIFQQEALDLAEYFESL